MEKQEKKQRKLLTDNRMTTISKRETSFEGLVSQLENGEDGIYNLMNESKTTIFQPKVSITKKDLADIPPLAQLRQAIDQFDRQLKRTEGKDAFIIKRALIEMRKDQYLIKAAYRRPFSYPNMVHSKFFPSLDEISNGPLPPTGISLCSFKVCQTILCNYSALKEECYGEFMSDLWYLMEAFDDISGKALADYPLYEEIVTAKIDGLQNFEIQSLLLSKYGVRHSPEYISSLWRRKIPSLIASAAEEDFLNDYYLTKEKGTYKKCSRCGQVKLAHPKFFCRNRTSKDGYYSICKACRNKRKGGRLNGT